MEVKNNELKKVSAVGTLPLADSETLWNADDAIKRVRKFTNSIEEPSVRYRRAFMYYDEDMADNFTAYKLPYADIINGQMKAVPRAIYAIAGALDGAHGGVDLPLEDREQIEKLVNRYYKKMGKKSPLEKSLNFNEEKKVYNVEDVDHILTKRDLEEFLRDSGVFTKKASTLIASRFGSDNRRESDKEKETFDDKLDNDLKKELFNSLAAIEKSFKY